MNYRKIPWRLLLCAAVAIALNGSDPFPAQRNLPETRIEICGVSLMAEVANHSDQWILGLGHRTRLEHGRGMLFIFDKVRQLAFTSRNMYLPLSIAFIDGDNVIQEIHDLGSGKHDAERVESEEEFQLALEVPFGWFDDNAIAVGCEVSGIR